MKNILTVLILFLFCALNAQSVEESKTTMSLGPQNGFYVVIEGANKDIVEEAWKEYTKEYGKPKANKKAKEFITEKAKVALIAGSKPITLYVRHDEGKNQMTTNLWVDLGDGFVSSSVNAAEARGVQTFLKDFWVVARKKVISKELEMEEKKGKQLAKDLEKLADKKKDNDEEIEKCKKKIVDLENSNVTNLKDQEAKKAEIELQKRKIQAVIDRLNAVGKSI